jgi:hypothetical protein
LRRLAGSHRRRLAASLAPGPVPAAWRGALQNFDASAFGWTHGSSGGRGLLLYCPACGRATMMQFLGRELSRSEAIGRRLLGSWRDHSSDGLNLWALFDIRAEVPERLQLKTYRFEVGCFQLTFGDGRLRIDLYRWAPAAALLRSGDLQQLARQFTAVADAPAAARSVRGNPGVEWHTRPEGGGWNAWRQRLLRRAAHRCVRVWHLEAQNRILGLAAESARPLDLLTVDRICERYAVVQTPQKRPAGTSGGS